LAGIVEVVAVEIFIFFGVGGWSLLSIHLSNGDDDGGVHDDEIIQAFEVVRTARVSLQVTTVACDNNPHPTADGSTILAQYGHNWVKHSFYIGFNLGLGHLITTKSIGLAQTTSTG